jgi:hypothetical protein
MSFSITYNVLRLGEVVKYGKQNFNLKINIMRNENMNEAETPQLNIGAVSGSAKLTFGLTAKNLEVIQKYTSRWEGAEFDRDTWIRVGEEIGWEALTACLWYFRKHYR